MQVLDSWILDSNDPSVNLIQKGGNDAINTMILICEILAKSSSIAIKVIQEQKEHDSGHSSRGRWSPNV